jgi:hypothetical protein
MSASAITLIIMAAWIGSLLAAHWIGFLSGWTAAMQEATQITNDLLKQRDPSP